MILLPCGDLYYNTQVYFRKHVIDHLLNDQQVWAQQYREWLAEQGCEIVLSNNRALRNSLNVSPFYDSFGFRNEADATAFLLRWS